LYILQSCWQKDEKCRPTFQKILEYFEITNKVGCCCLLYNILYLVQLYMLLLLLLFTCV